MKGSWWLGCLATLVACQSLINADFDKKSQARAREVGGEAGTDTGRSSDDSGAGGDGQEPPIATAGANLGGDAGQTSPSGAGEGGRAEDTGHGGSGLGDGAGQTGDDGGHDRGGNGGATPVGASVNPDWDLPAVVPFCYTHRDSVDGLSLNPSSAVGVQSVSPGEQLTVIATVPSDQVVGVRWMTGGTPPWVSWSCFDALPEPARAAGIGEEVFVTTQHGSLFNRFMGVNKYWTQWRLIQRPTSSSAVRDVAAFKSSTRSGDVLLATSEGLYWAERLGFDVARGYSYSPWKLLSPKLFERVALCGDQPVKAFALAGTQLFDVDLATGAVLPLREAKSASLVDIDCSGTSSPITFVYGVADDGALLGWSRSSFGVTDATVVLKAASVGPSLVSLSVARRPIRDFLFATDVFGKVLLSNDAGVTWTTDNWAIE